MADKGSSNSTNAKGNCSDMSSLLDRAFDEIINDMSTSNQVPQTVVESDLKSCTSSTETEPSPSDTAIPISSANNADKWSADSLAKEFEQHLESLVNGDSSQLDSLLESFMNDPSLADFSAAANRIDTASSPTSSAQSNAKPPVEQKLEQTLEDLTKKLNKLPNGVAGQDSGLNGESEDGSDNMMPFLEDIMHQFLSKEVLYPVFSETSKKYPDWLHKNKDSLSETDRKSYEEQSKIMQRVVDEFDKESPSDSPEVKKRRFNVILQLLQDMQKWGSPPADLVGADKLPSLGDQLDGACSIS